MCDRTGGSPQNPLDMSDGMRHDEDMTSHLPRSLATLVVEDVKDFLSDENRWSQTGAPDQRQAVADLAEWEHRDGGTSDLMEYLVGRCPGRRTTRAMVALWFAAALEGAR